MRISIRISTASEGLEMSIIMTFKVFVSVFGEGLIHNIPVVEATSHPPLENQGK